jgi:hypothetical protein
MMRGANGLCFYLRYLPATAKNPERKAVLYAHGARLASAVTIAHRFDGLSWRDDLASDGWGVEIDPRRPSATRLPPGHETQECLSSLRVQAV